MNPLPPQPKWFATSKTDNACLITSESNMCITMIDSTSFTSQGHIVTNKRWHDVATHELNELLGPTHFCQFFFCLTTHKPSIFNFCELQVLFVCNKYASTVVRTSNYHQEYHFIRRRPFPFCPWCVKRYIHCQRVHHHRRYTQSDRDYTTTADTLQESTPPPPMHYYRKYTTTADTLTEYTTTADTLRESTQPLPIQCQRVHVYNHCRFAAREYTTAADTLWGWRQIQCSFMNVPIQWLQKKVPEWELHESMYWSVHELTPHVLKRR